MQRLSHLLLLVIALVAGLALGTAVDRPATAGRTIGAEADPETARAFYRALDQALSGGGTEALGALLGSGFLDHDSSVGEAQTAGGFLDRMRKLGQTPGVARLSVESIETSGNSLIVQVSQAAPGPRELAGISAEPRDVRPNFEVLRVSRGRVIDRWSQGIEWLEAIEFEDVLVPPPGFTNIATLMRLDIPAGVVHRLTAVEKGLLVIESGSAVMRAVHLNGEAETHELDRGSATRVTPTDRVQLRSADGEPVTALVYTVKPTFAMEAPEDPLPTSASDAQFEGATLSLLWRGSSPQTNDGGVQRLARMILPAGSEVGIAGATRATLALAIDSGAIELGAPGGSISILGEDLWPVEHDNFARIDARHAASLTGASAVTLRNVSDHPVAITLVVMQADT